MGKISDKSRQNDEFDWTIIDPDVEFAELYGDVDTYLLGRRTFEVAGGAGLPGSSGNRIFVFSRTLRQTDYPNVQIVGGNWLEMVRNLREEPGNAIWLFGGGALFGSLCEEGLVDSAEVAIMPILLGGGIPLVSGLSERIEFKLKGQRTYEKTGTVNQVHGVKSLLNE